MIDKIIVLVILLFGSSLNSQHKGVTQMPAATNGIAGAMQNSSTYAVVIGISDYQDPGIPDLRFADKDAEAFARYLRSNAGGKLDNDHLKVLINKEATMAQFANALDWLWENAKENDQVIIYFSGHGDVEKKSLTQPGFLLCWDAPARVYMAGGAFALPMLQEVVSTLSIQNKAKVIVITDACRSGMLAGSSVGGSQATAANLAKQFGNEIKIMSCQPNEYSIEGEQWGGGRGAFSYHLLDALYGLADNNNDQWVTLQEVGRYLEDHVSNEVAPVSQVPMTVGNRNERLTSVDETILASIKSGKTNQTQMLSAIESRGIEEEVLSKLDSTTKRIYKKFKDALKNKQFLTPENECAESYYTQLINEPKLERLKSTMRRNYAAALQDDAQQVMNTYLKTGLTEDVLSCKNPALLYKDYPAYLERAGELLGTMHYMYKSLQARKNYFKGRIQSNLKESKKYFLEALQWESNLSHASEGLISIWNADQLDSAVYYARKTMELSPTWVMPYVDLSNFFNNKLKQFEKADSLLDQAYKLDSNSVLVWYSKAKFYKKREEFDKSMYWFKKILANTKDEFYFPCAHTDLGDLILITGRYEEAERHFQKAIQYDSTFVGALNRLGKVYYSSNRFEKAITVLNRSIDLVGDDPFIHNELGNTYSRMKNFKDAETHYLKSIELDTNFFASYYNLAADFITQNRFEEAERYAKMIILKDSLSDYGYDLLAYLYAKSNRPVEAEYYSLKSIEINPSFAAYYTLACVYSLANKTEKGFQNLEESLKRGFTDYDWIQQDTDLNSLKEQKEKWNALMKKYFPDK